MRSSPGLRYDFTAPMFPCTTHPSTSFLTLRGEAVSQLPIRASMSTNRAFFWASKRMGRMTSRAGSGRWRMSDQPPPYHH